MQTIQFIYDHWGAFSGWLVAAYHVISNAGGLRTIAANILGPNKSTSAVENQVAILPVQKESGQPQKNQPNEESKTP